MSQENSWRRKFSNILKYDIKTGLANNNLKRFSAARKVKEAKHEVTVAKRKYDYLLK